jgi:hypothetical protein
LAVMARSSAVAAPLTLRFLRSTDRDASLLRQRQRDELTQDRFFDQPRPI